jgi:hypothetical protein
MTRRKIENFANSKYKKQKTFKVHKKKGEYPSLPLVKLHIIIF